MKKKLHLRGWVKDVIFGIYFGLVFYIGIMFGVGIW